MRTAEASCQGMKLKCLNLQLQIREFWFFSQVPSSKEAKVRKPDNNLFHSFAHLSCYVEERELQMFLKVKKKKNPEETALSDIFAISSPTILIELDTTQPSWRAGEGGGRTLSFWPWQTLRSNPWFQAGWEGVRWVGEVWTGPATDENLWTESTYKSHMKIVAVVPTIGMCTKRAEKDDTRSGCPMCVALSVAPWNDNQNSVKYFFGQNFLSRGTISIQFFRTSTTEVAYCLFGDQTFSKLACLNKPQSSDLCSMLLTINKKILIHLVSIFPCLIRMNFCKICNQAKNTTQKFESHS